MATVSPPLVERARTLALRVVAAAIVIAPGMAWAMPPVVGMVGAYALVQAGYYTAAFLFSLAVSVYGSIEARREAAVAAARARADYNASLSDRAVTVLRSDPPWVIVYGRCRVGGAIVDIFTTDAPAANGQGTKADGFKHLVIVVAAHEVVDIHEMYIDGVAVGALNAAGWATTGEFHRTSDETVTIEVAGSIVLSTRPAKAIIDAFSQEGFPEGGYTVIQESVTIADGGFRLVVDSGRTARVTYTVDPVTATNPGKVRWSKHLGAADQAADAYLVAVAPERYASGHRLRGIAYVTVTLDLQEVRFQGGPPNFTFDVSGRRIYDPRRDSTVAGGSGTHRASDPSTWEWSANPALCMRDFIVAEFGLAAQPEDVNVPMLIAAANVCDVAIDLTVGAVTEADQPAYTCNGAFDTNQAPESVLDDLARSMGGFAAYGAEWQISAGGWVAPVMSLTDVDLSGQIEVVQTDTRGEDLVNGVRGQYFGAGAGAPTDYNPYQNETLVAIDGGVELWKDVQLPYTDHLARARNLCRLFVERNRSGQVLRYPANMRAWVLQVGDRVSVTSAEYGLSAKPYRVTDWQFAVGAPVMLTLQEDDASIYDLADAALADPAPNTGLPSPWHVAAPQDVSAASGSAHLVRMADGTIATRVRVAWTPHTDAAVLSSGAIEIQWQGPWVGSWQRMDVPPDESLAYITGVRDAEPLVVKVRARNGLGAVSDWVVLAHTVVGKTEPPPDVRLFTVIEQPLSGRAYFWDAQATPDLAGFLARYAAGSGPVEWAGMAPLFEAGPGERSRDAKAPPDGEWTIAIKAVDSSGNSSLAAAIVNVVFDQGGFGFAIFRADCGGLGWPGTKSGCGLSAYYLKEIGSLTWDTIPTTWDAWDWWDGPSGGGSISYQHTTIDLGAVKTIRVRAGSVAAGTTTTEYQSSTDGATYGAWAGIPSGTFSARYVRVRWTVDGDLPILYRASIEVYES